MSENVQVQHWYIHRVPPKTAPLSMFKNLQNTASFVQILIYYLKSLMFAQYFDYYAIIPRGPFIVNTVWLQCSI